MKEIGAQLLIVWKQAKPRQKVTGLSTILFIFALLVVVMMQPFSKEPQEKGGVAEEEALLELSSTISGQKGFELFDTNTWIKGEKELQVLEMRALKGQLEKDLAEFDQIKCASVILDMAPGKSFGGAKHKTKASVILTLNPDTKLSTSQMRAITYHLSGAVHGLEPNMIAISDTTGKLYKVLDPDGEEELLSNAALVFEEHLGQKVDTLLSLLLGEKHYHSSVQGVVEKGEKQPHSFSIAVTIDKEFEEFKESVERQLNAIALGYEVPYHLALDVIPFEKKGGAVAIIEEKRGYVGLTLTLIVVVIALACIYPLFRKYSKQKQEETLFKVMTRIDVEKLADSVKAEDPQTIALMLSYLEPARAEQLILYFPEELQEEILNNLSELEYDNY